MQSAVRTAATSGSSASLRNPLLGNRITLTVAAPSTSAALPSRSVVTMAKKKGVRLIVTVECTEARGLGETPSRYVTQKNRRNTPERLEISKYNPNLRRHTIHREVK
jgi:large subunit ribosomal protein L33